jgi:hypothetical protein
VLLQPKNTTVVQAAMKRVEAGVRIEDAVAIGWMMDESFFGVANTRFLYFL